MTTTTDLVTAEGVRRRLLLRIDGLPYDLWQDDGTGPPKRAQQRIIASNDGGEFYYDLTGTTWAKLDDQPSGAKVGAGLWGGPNGTIYGHNGLAAGSERYLHYDGSTWTEFAAPDTNEPYCLHGSDDASHIYSACTGTIHKWDGASWSIVHTGGDNQSIWCDSTGQYVWATPCNGPSNSYILYSDDYGATWTDVYSDANSDVDGWAGYTGCVWGLSANEVYVSVRVASTKGRVLRWDGSSWGWATDTCNYALATSGLWVADAGNIWALGYNVNGRYFGCYWGGGEWDYTAQWDTDTTPTTGRNMIGTGTDEVVCAMKTLAGNEKIYRTTSGASFSLMIAVMGNCLTSLSLLNEDITVETYGRDGVACLLPPAEVSDALDLKTCKPQQSGMTFDLVDFPDPDDESLSYLGQFFCSPGAAGDASQHWRLAKGTSPHEVLDADATTIPLEDSTGIPSSGTAYIGGEKFTYTGVSGNNLTGCTRGVHPALADDTGGLTHRRPTATQVGVEAPPLVTQKPWTVHGLRVRLLAVTKDRATGTWNTPTGARTIFAGRITTDVQYVRAGPNNVPIWRVACDSLTAELERKVLQDLHTARLAEYINLNGDIGRTFYLSTSDADGFPLGGATITVPAGTYTLQSLYYEVQERVVPQSETYPNGAVWHHPRTGAEVGAPLVSLRDPQGTAIGFKNFSFTSLSWDATQLEFRCDEAENVRFAVFPGWSTGRSHVLGALGFTKAFTAEEQYDWCVFDHDADAYRATIKADAPPAIAYHPISQAANGSKLLLADGELITNQGDDPYQAQAFCMFPDAVIDPRTDKKGVYYARYTALAWTQLLSGESFYQATLAADPLWVGRFVPAYVAQRRGDPTVSAQQVYCPVYKRANGYRVGPFEALLPVLLSTGTESYNGVYDRLPPGWGVGVHRDLIDDASFRIADAELTGDTAERGIAENHNVYAVDEAISPLELLQRECVLYGYALCWARGSGIENRTGGQALLTLRNVMEPRVDWITVTVDDSTGVKPEEMHQTASPLGNVINRYECETIYDAHAGKYLKPITLTDGDSRDMLGGHTGVVKVKHPGLPLSTDINQVDKALVAGALGQLLLGRMIRMPRQEVNVSLAPHYEQQVFVGDVVRYVNSYLPDPHGSGGSGIDCPALVVDKSWNYGNWLGRVKLQLLTQHRLMTVAPGGLPWGAHANQAGILIGSVGGPWSPAAMVDIDAGNGGLDATNYHLVTIPQFWTTHDLSNYDLERFRTGDYVAIIEAGVMDPSAAPSFWSNVMVSGTDVPSSRIYVTGNHLAGWDYTREHWVQPAKHIFCYEAQRDGGSWYADYTSRLLSGLYQPVRWG